MAENAGVSLGILGGLGVLHWGFGLKSREKQGSNNRKSG